MYKIILITPLLLSLSACAAPLATENYVNRKVAEVKIIATNAAATAATALQPAGTNGFLRLEDLPPIEIPDEKDPRAMRLYHYGDTDIVESPADWFVFDGAGTITGYNYVAGREDVVIPWEIGGVPVTSIGNSAFAVHMANGYPIKTVIAPKTVTSIGDSAFYSCDSLTSVDFPAVTSIGDSAFGACYSLTSVDFHAVTSIGDSAFGSCYSLTSVDFHAVTSIGDYAFSYCESLTSVTTAANAPTVGTGAFISTHANLVITVTDPTATGWGATFGGRPVVRLDLYGGAVYSGGSLVVTEKTKELHNDSYTNLVWRNVFSNGWVWLVAYTNIPTGGTP